MKRIIWVVIVMCIFFESHSSMFAGNYEDGLDATDSGDFKTAFEKWKPLAEQGDSRAQFFIGGMYYEGKGVTQNRMEAFKWLRLAAEQGNEDAQYYLGRIYYERKGIFQDPKEAIKWFRLAAEQGDSRAQFSLGNMYKNGEGVTQNYIEAHKWFNISGANGYMEGPRNRDLIAKRMTPSDISEAQRLAKEWMEKHEK